MAPDIILISLLLLLSGSIIHEDFSRFEITSWKLYALIGLAVLASFVCVPPKASLSLLYVGGATGVALGGFFYGYAKLRFKLEAFGLGDVLILAAGGLLLGPYLLGIWLFVAAIGTLVAFVFFRTALGARMAPFETGGHIAIPFAPPLLLTLLAMRAGASFAVLPVWPS